jgi:hypothetical protein
MRRRRITVVDVLVSGLVLATLAVIVAYFSRQHDLAAWPTYTAFRCRECGRPASVDPHDNHWWGCRQCRTVTRKLADCFRVAKEDDFPSKAAMLRSYWRAGMMCPAEEYGTLYEGSPVQAWDHYHARSHPNRRDT